MIGRSEELESLLGRVRRLVDDGAAAAVIVEGEAGIGKSTLLAALAREARSLPVAIVTGAGDPIEMDVPYRVWGQVLRALFGGGDGVAPLRVDHRDADERSWWEARRSLLEALLGHDTGPLPWEGESLAVEMQEVVVRALACATVERPVLLLLEDAHWFDSSSWRVVRLAIEQVPRAMLVVATRPLPADTAAEPGRLLLLPGLVRLVLGPLAAAEAEALARRSLDVGGRSTPLVELLLERTRGHPMFIAELARSLGTGRDGVSAGAVTAERLAGGPWADELPPTVEALLAARIDALPARHQLVLKVGSVLGPTFALPTLHSVFPAELDAVTLAADVDELCEAGLLQRGRGADEFEFRHAIARDAAYVTLLHAQRRQLHEAVARWLEGQDGGDSAAGVARLAYHWTEAATVDAALVPTAIEWLGRAGEMAAARYANREVLRFLGQAIAFLGSGGPMAVSLAQRVRWERLLGEACFGLGELERAGVHLRRALELAPIAHPRTRRAMAAGLARGVVRQAVSRMRPPAAAADRATAEPRVLLEEAASAYNFLQIIAFIEMDGLAAAHAAIRSANLAERGGASRPLVYALSGVGLLVGMFSGAAARRYHALALATAERLGDRRATLGPWYVRGYLHMRAGGWTDAESAFRQAQAVAAEYGDRRFWEMCEMQLGCVRYTCGDFAAGLERYRAAEASARRRGDVDAQALALVGAATALAHLGATRDGLHCLANVDEWLGPDFIGVRDRGIRINALGTRALLLWRNGARGEAMAAARAAAACIASSPLLAHYALAGYAAVAEVAVAAARAGADDPWVRRTALRGLRRFRFAFPFARAQELLWRGADAARRGRRRRALRLLRAGLRSATELALVHEQHLLRRELAALAGPR
jgi:tetratricopeptide (TPR) repeat protein